MFRRGAARGRPGAIDTATDEVTWRKCGATSGRRRASAARSTSSAASSTAWATRSRRHGERGAAGLPSSASRRAKPSTRTTSARWLPAYGARRRWTVIAVTDDGMATTPGRRHDDYADGAGHHLSRVVLRLGLVALPLAALRDPVGCRRRPSLARLLSRRARTSSSARAGRTTRSPRWWAGRQPRRPGVALPGFVLDVARIRWRRAGAGG